MKNKFFNCVTSVLLVAGALPVYGSAQFKEAVIPPVADGYELAKRLDNSYLKRMANDEPVSIVSSEVTTDGLIKEVINDNGIYISYMRAPETPRPTWDDVAKWRAHPRTETSDTDGYIMFESFEEAPSYDQTWYPDDWYQFSLAGNVFKPANGSATKVWMLSIGAASGGVSDGEYQMWMNDELYADFYATSWHDEWLVTRPFTPDAYSMVEFDYWFLPLFMINNVNDREPTSTLRIYASLDNGETWEDEPVWDVSDTVKKMDRSEIYAGGVGYYRAVWHTFQVNISKYAGKEIRLAFRQMAITSRSQSVALDRIVVRGPMPEASYALPKGMFRWSYAEGLTFPSAGGSPMVATLAPAYEEQTWTNTSNDECATFEWNFANPDGSENEVKFTEKSPTMEAYPYCQSPFPVLTGTNEEPIFSSTYTPDPKGVGYIQYGGEAIWGGNKYGVGTFDISKYITVYRSTDADDSFVFGSNNRETWQVYKLRGITNMFDAPVRPYLLSNVWAKAVNVVCADDVVLEMTICRVDGSGNVLPDTIATAKCYGYEIEQIYDDGSFKYYNIPFRLGKYDQFGFYIYQPVEISTAIAVTIRGFDDAEKFPSIGFASQAYDHDNGENHAYAYVKRRNQPEEFKALPDLFNMLWSSYVFTLDVTYPFMKLESDSELAYGPAGGSRTVQISYYDPNATFLDDCEISLPDWVQINELSNDGVNHALQVSTDPLPDGTPIRFGSITISSVGNDDIVLNITQDINTGINGVTGADCVKVTRMGDSGVRLEYAADTYSRVQVVSVSGQVVRNEAVSGTGCTIDGLGRGVYFVRLGGRAGEATVKVII